MSGRRRALVLGLDVGDGDLVREWAARGDLPHLARLIETGTWGRLSTPADTLHVSAWPTLYTGAPPGVHGVYYTHQPEPATQGAVRFRADQYGAPPVWQLLDAAGRRCVVLDAPYTHRTPGFGGLEILEWGTWAHYGRPSSTPPGALRTLERACGRYPLGLEAGRVGLDALEPDDLCRRLVRAAAARSRAVRHLMAREDWDLFFTVFSETHPAAHYFWPAELDAPARGGGLERLRAVYAAVDTALGEVLAALDADGRGPADVFVVSGDGCGPNRAGWHLLPEVLARLGLTVPPAGAPGSAGAARGAQPSGSAAPPPPGTLARLKRAVSRRLPEAVRDALMRRNAAKRIDWPRSRAFCLPTDFEGCLRVNLCGREPHGIVAPGAAYEAVCEELAAALEELENPATGAPAVRSVVRCDRAFPGPRREHLPDLVVTWRDEAPIAALRSQRVGLVAGPSPDQRGGTHRAPGFALVRAAGIPPGELPAGAHVVDLAPTLLARLGLSAPGHVRGRDWTASSLPA